MIIPMTTETEIEEIARRLGWKYRPETKVKDGVFCACLTDPLREVYPNPETNADLHMRWMVEHGVWARPVELFGVRLYEAWILEPHSGLPANFKTPHEAIRAALLAKLRSKQDEN